MTAKKKSIAHTFSDWKRPVDFAFIKEKTEQGNILSISGMEYHAWDYDVYIYDAIHLAEKWQPTEITFARIIHLRNWLRENVQHGHDKCFEHLASMRSVKNWIDELIEVEYGHDEYWTEQKGFFLKGNAALFKKSKNA
ncbi:hypothetical protein [Ferruginibacter sp.]